ncbi:hypothetical protein ACFE04_003603 [Oxalis oulophora]
MSNFANSYKLLEFCKFYNPSLEFCKFDMKKSVIVLICCCLITLIAAQQPYVSKDTTNCDVINESKSDLGYFSNGQNPSCQSYLSFRSKSPYDNVTSISNLLSANPSEVSSINGLSETENIQTDTLVFVPVNCSSSGQFYQTNTTYVVRSNDNVFFIANNTYQGLTTCQAIRNQTSTSNSTQIFVGQSLNIPLRCACPTKNQTDAGTKYLLSYLVTWNEFVSTISQRFGVDTQKTLEANELSLTNSGINPFTTLLVPLESPPNVSQTISPPPPPSSQPSPPPPGSGKSKTWVYVLIGVLAGVFAIVLVVVSVFFYKRKKKTDPIIVSEKFEDYEKTLGKQSEEMESEDFLESVSSIAQSLKVYKYGELVLATDNFSPSCWINGSVYRGNFNGDFAAIKKMNGDVSKEINLLSMINHTNVIRLSGVCFYSGNWYLVYEYAVNGLLTDWIYDENSENRKVLTWTERMKIGLDVAMGLDYLHSFTTPPHVHKDIKSGNILLDGNFRGKIINFGLARSAEAEEGEFALTRHIVGTKGYMAPEYLEHGLVSTKLDVFSFGVLLLEMVTGKEAAGFYAEEKRSLSTLLSDENREEDLKLFVDPSMEGNYPLELVKFVIRLIDRCVKKDPMDRPSMDEIVQSLSMIVDSSIAFEKEA